jgi:4a-hydroxytetrahydrobiopterin dehydratase
MQKLKEDEIHTLANGLISWKIEDNCLTKEFGFKGFSTALSFMNQLAPLAEKLDHHPDWANSYNKVSIKLTTHQAHGLTKNDFIFAKAADEIAEKLRR